jgi:hypothetical protein
VLLRTRIPFVLAVVCGVASVYSTTGCNKPSGDTQTTSASANANTGAAAKPTSATPPPKPTATGPVFKAKMMGMDMDRPLVETSLAPAGLDGLVIQAPEGAKVEKHVPGGGARVVAAGVNYSVAIREGKFDAKSVKSTYAIIDPKGTIAMDTPDLIIFERANGGSVLFNMGLTVGGKSYTCSSVATAASFTRDVIDQTVESCKTLKKK